MNKRGRKLTDFDSARHNVATLQNAKKPDPAKISKVSTFRANSRKT